MEDARVHIAALENKVQALEAANQALAVKDDIQILMAEKEKQIQSLKAANQASNTQFQQMQTKVQFLDDCKYFSF